MARPAALPVIPSLRNNDGETDDIIAEKLSREQIIITKAGERPKVPSIFI